MNQERACSIYDDRVTVRRLQIGAEEAEPIFAIKKTAFSGRTELFSGPIRGISF